MNLRPLALAGIFAAGLALPSVADAATGRVNVTANLRTGPGTGFERITTIPAGAPIEVFGCSSWCSVNYHGYQGYVAASLISTRGGYANNPGPGYRQWPGYGPQPRFMRPPPPQWGYYQSPWWDDRYAAWYDGRRWYHQGRWYNQPGFYLGFRFGG